MAALNMFSVWCADPFILNFWISTFESYGNTSEKESFAKKRVSKSLKNVSQLSVAIGITTRYNCGQNSFTNIIARSSANDNFCHDIFRKNKSIIKIVMSQLTIVEKETIDSSILCKKFLTFYIIYIKKITKRKLELWLNHYLLISRLPSNKFSKFI